MFGIGESSSGVQGVVLLAVVGLVAAILALALLLLVGQVTGRRRRSSYNRFIPMGRVSPVLGGLALLVVTLVMAPALGRMVGVDVPGVSFAWLGQ